MNKYFVFIFAGYLLTQVETQNVTNAETSTCPCNITLFEKKFYEETSKDFRVIDTMARKYIMVAVVTQIPRIVRSCPEFCLSNYIARAVPLIDAGTLKASDDAAKLDTKIAVSVVRNSTCRYNYASLLSGSLPGITSNMKNCARKVGVSAVTAAVEALKAECPNLKKSTIEVISSTMSTTLKDTLSPLANIAAAVTAKNILSALPCGSWQIIRGTKLPSLPGVGEFSMPRNVPGDLSAFV